MLPVSISLGAGSSRGAALGGESIAGTEVRQHKQWRDRQLDPPEVALYGASKVAKTKPAVIDQSH